MDKVRYFLKTFKNVEWSGPAWYSHVKDEEGFPSIITLEYWHPLDLGTHSNTDWDGEDLIKIYSKLRKKHPEIGKSWVQGNIHSHHNMGAFYSGTDEQQCIDGANENFYYSLVVSTKKDKEWHFGVSYPDQFGQVHIQEIDDIEVQEVYHVEKSWKEQAAFIKKNKKAEPNTLALYQRGKQNKYNNIGQAQLFGSYVSKGQQKGQQKETKQDRYEEHIDALSYNASYSGLNKRQQEEMYSWDLFDEFDDVMMDYERGKITKTQLNKKLKKIGVDEYGRPIPA